MDAALPVASHIPHRSDRLRAPLSAMHVVIPPASELKTADDVFVEALRLVLERGSERLPSRNPSSPHSRFGKGGEPLLEATDVLLDVGTPGSVQLRNPIRKASYFRSLGMAAWNLMASSDLAAVSLYNPNAQAFSDDGRVIRAPWGARLLTNATGRSPIASVLDQLAADPGGMRGVAPVYEPSDVAVDSRDVPCLLNLCFAVSGRALHVTAVFRALNAYGVLPYDHALIACLAEAARAHLELDGVRMKYFVRSLHFPIKDLPLVSAALAVEQEVRIRGPVTKGPRWRGDIDEASARLGVLEPTVQEALRDGGRDLSELTERLNADSTTWAGPLLAMLVSSYATEKSNLRGVG